MTATADRALIWAPRILTLAFAAFVSVFALDVFGEGRPMGWVVVALIMHLIPSIVLLVIALVAWRFEWIGAITTAGLALLYVLTKGPTLPWTDDLFIAGPLAVIALLYAVNALRHQTPAQP